MFWERMQALGVLDACTFFWPELGNEESLRHSYIQSTKNARYQENRTSR